MGLGETGLSYANFFADKEIPLIFYDDNKFPRKLNQIRHLYPDANYYLDGNICTENFTMVLISPGISPSHELIQQITEKSITILTDLDIFCSFNDAKKIIITGTNGKTTVATIIHKILSSAGIASVLGGNIFPPILDLINKKGDIFVIEASSFQLHYSNNIHANISVILNICEDHLDWHPSFDDYKKAKLKLTNCSDEMVINTDDDITLDNSNILNVLNYGIENQERADFTFDKTKESSTITLQQEKYLTINNPYLDFYHNKSNLLAITCICHLLNIDKNILKMELENFNGLPHRMETITTNDNIQWINDSKSTNSSSLYAAISSFKRNTTLIMGGDDKGSKFNQLHINLRKSSVKKIILIGKSKKRFLSILGSEFNCSMANNLEEAVKIASNFAETNEIVLFSPGCSSKDMFIDYIDRGNCFIESINNYSSKI
ncbi:MAG: UDP-N-acetylmuramoyl-L-alanine--D-glutamate ligase [Gammaproteobacteria bacterium]|nr:UDP-N-acetylmuramoyl-L-alanine--D-glutamate ligase [Gammaproteobacteria bacterium]